MEKLPNAKGNNLIKIYLDGGILTIMESIHAKCADCMGYYVDGRVDCKVPTCPLYPFMFYNKRKRTARRKRGANSGSIRQSTKKLT